MWWATSVDFEAKEAYKYRPDYVVRCDLWPKLVIRAFMSLDTNIASPLLIDNIVDLYMYIYFFS